MTSSSPNPPTIEETAQYLRITWQGKQDNFNAIRSGFIILVYIGFAAWVSHLLQDMRLQGSEFSLASWIVLGITVIYLLSSAIWRAIHVMESLMDHEIITIDEQSISFVRNGPGRLKQRARIPAAQVKYIHQTISGFNRVVYLEPTTIGSLQSRFRPIALPAFCRGISETDATIILSRIHERFPHYRYVKIQTTVSR
jgi:hypothetical protein